MGGRRPTRGGLQVVGAPENIPLLTVVVWECQTTEDLHIRNKRGTLTTWRHYVMSSSPPTQEVKANREIQIDA